MKINYSTDWLIEEQSARGHMTSALEEIKRINNITGWKIVELGSGVGNNLKIFKNDNHVMGVEGMEEATSIANANGIPTVAGNLEDGNLDLKCTDVDMVMCIDVLEHLSNPEACLNQVKKILKKNGRLLINVPNHFDWRGRINVICGSGIDSQGYFKNSEVWRYPHIRFFRHRDICKLLESNGFKISADLSNKFVSFPKLKLIRRLGLIKLIAKIQKNFPDLFSSGFLIEAVVD